MAQACRRASAEIVVHSWAGTGVLPDSGRPTNKSGAQRLNEPRLLQRPCLTPVTGPSTNLSIICYSD